MNFPLVNKVMKRICHPFVPFLCVYLNALRIQHTCTHDCMHACLFKQCVNRFCSEQYCMLSTFKLDFFSSQKKVDLLHFCMKLCCLFSSAVSQRKLHHQRLMGISVKVLSGTEINSLHFHLHPRSSSACHSNVRIQTG